MSDTVQVLLQYGYLVLFAFVLAEQVGPADPRGTRVARRRRARLSRADEPGARGSLSRL